MSAPSNLGDKKVILWVDMCEIFRSTDVVSVWSVLRCQHTEWNDVTMLLSRVLHFNKSLRFSVFVTIYVAGTWCIFTRLRNFSFAMYLFLLGFEPSSVINISTVRVEIYCQIWMHFIWQVDSSPLNRPPRLEPILESFLSTDNFSKSSIKMGNLLPILGKKSITLISAPTMDLLFCQHIWKQI